MDTQAALQDMLNFMQHAGDYAQMQQATAQAHFKADQSLVTEVDLEITRMAKAYFAHWLALPNHTLIDEESFDDLGTPAELFENSEYQWVLDPIDGTAPFAAGLPFWGILLAVLKRGVPLLGVMYLPGYKHNGCIWTDGHKAYVNNIPEQSAAQEIFPTTRTFHAEDFLCGAVRQFQHPKELPFKQLSTWSSITLMAAVVQGQAVGYVHRNKIVDFAAGWAIGRVLNLHPFAAATGAAVHTITPEMLTPSWTLRTAHIFTRPDMLATLHPLVDPTAKEYQNR